jgi:hypothetical protein
MTHFVGLVVGPNLEGQLERYDENRQVEPYETPVYMGDWFADELKTNGISVDDPHAVAAYYNGKYADDGGAFVRDGVVVETTTYNPDSKWDWYSIGGRWAYCLVRHDGGSTNAAPADEIDWLATFANWGGSPCGVVVAEGVWRARDNFGWFGMSAPTEHAEGWDEWFVGGSSPGWATPSSRR